MTSARYRFRNIEGLGATAALWLIINAIGDAALTVWSIVDTILIARPEVLSDEAYQVWQLSGLIAFVQIGLFLVTVVIVGRWIYRASANTHASGHRLEISPPWAVGWYFVPFANLWKPYQAMSEIVRLNRSPGPDLPVALWWGLWLASGILGNIGARMPALATETGILILASAFTVASGVAGVGAALTLRRIIIAVTDAQTAHKQADVF